MTVIIKDAETDVLIRTLAERTGETLTDTVKNAVREQLKRVQFTEDEVKVRKQKMKELLAKFDALQVVDPRSPDEIIGYNERGHFD
jgi:antitoxin VapB